MKILLKKLFVAFLGCIIVLVGVTCNNKNVARTGKAVVKPVDDLNRSFQYCRYEVTGAPNKGVAAIKVGELICIKCAANQSGCDNFSEIEMGDKQVYPVKAKDNGLACTSCPVGTATPPGYPFELE